jgi:hypothetical protein
LGRRTRAAGVIHSSCDNRFIDVRCSRERDFNSGRVRGGRRWRWWRRRGGDNRCGSGRKRGIWVLCQEIHSSAPRFVLRKCGNWWIGRRCGEQRRLAWGKHDPWRGPDLQWRLRWLWLRFLNLVRLHRRWRGRRGGIDRWGYQHWRSGGRERSDPFSHGRCILCWRKFLLRRWRRGCTQCSWCRGGQLRRRWKRRIYPKHYKPARRKWKLRGISNLGVSIIRFKDNLAAPAALAA